MEEVRTHSLLSPSAAHRWLHCHAAPALERLLPDTSTSYASEGTLAHALCAKNLKELLGLPTKAEQAEIKRLSREIPVTAEMQEHCDLFVANVMQTYTETLRNCPDARIRIEQTVDVADFAPGCKGTADALIVADNMLHVYDFKYGKGVKVDAAFNPQLMIYALGALAEYHTDYALDSVVLHIVQPRLNWFSEFHTDAVALLTWGRNTLAVGAQKCMSGSEEATPGEWCRFCRARSQCRALAEFGESAAMMYPDPRLLTPAQKAEALSKASTVKAWVNAVEESSLADALGGVKLPGYKIVEGRATRKIKDPNAAIALFRKAGVKRSLYMKAPTLRSLTELEKSLGRKAVRETIGSLIDRESGKPALVKESDTRPEYSAAAADFAGIPLED